MTGKHDGNSALKALDNLGVRVIQRSEFKYSVLADRGILPPESFALAHRQSHPRVFVLFALLWLRFLHCCHSKHSKTCEYHLYASRNIQRRESSRRRGPRCEVTKKVSHIPSTTDPWPYRTNDCSRQVVGSRQAALETALVLRQVISKERFHNIGQLVEIIRHVGKKLVEAQPKGVTHLCMYDILCCSISIVLSLLSRRAQSTLLATPFANYFTSSEKSTTTPRKNRAFPLQRSSPSPSSYYKGNRVNRSRPRRQSLHWC